jgi:hypothetical protein
MIIYYVWSVGNVYFTDKKEINILHNNNILGLVDGGRPVSRSRGSLVGGSSSVLGNTLVLHISNVSGLGVSHGVSDNLSPAVGKGNAVRSAGGVTVALLVLAKVHIGVVIGDSITKVIRGGLIVLGLVVGGPGGVGDGPGGVRDGSRGICRTGSVGAGNSHEGSEGDDDLNTIVKHC